MQKQKKKHELAAWTETISYALFSCKILFICFDNIQPSVTVHCHGKLYRPKCSFKDKIYQNIQPWL